MQLYAIKTVVELDRVRLNIRFPGTLSFQFKNAHLYEDLPKLYPLVNGECPVGESVALEVQALYNIVEDTYADVPVDLIVSINTVSGKIAAGTVTFNAVQNCSATLPLKRCSDKTAEATISIAYARIHKIRDVEEEPVAVKQKSESRLLAQVRSREKRSIEDLRPPPVMQQSEMKRENERNESKDTLGLVASKIMRQGGVGGLAADSRLKEVEENCERKVRQLNKEKEELEGQLENAREKWKQAERRQKELQTTLKDTREQAEKRRSRVTDLESKLSESQKAVQELERRIKQYQHEAKVAAERLQQSTGKYQLLQRKLEGRQQSLGDRQRRLAEKLAQLEGEHNRTVHEYNLLLEKMELQEKANQTIFKNKERSHLDERAKWKETAEKYEKNGRKLQEENEELTGKCNALLVSENALRMKLNELEGNYDLLKTADENRRLSMEREEALKKDLLRELDVLRSLEGDKAALKKRINESSQEQLKTKQKLDKLTLDNEQLREGLKTAEKLIEDYKKEKKVTGSRCADLERTVSQHQKQIARLLAEGNSLSSKNTYLNERLNDLKTKSDQQSATHADLEAQLQAKISSLFQSKQYLEADIEDLKWSLGKAEESTAECERKLKERSEEIFRYQEEKLKLEKEREDLSLKLQETQGTVDSMRGELSEARRKEQELQETLKDRERKIYEHLKRIGELEQDHFMASSKLTSNIQDFRDTLNTQQTTIEQLTEQVAAKKAKIAELQSQLEKLEEESQEQARELKMLTISLDESDRSLKLEREANIQLKKGNESLKRQLLDAQSKLSEEEKDYVERIQALTASKLALEKQGQANQADLDTYKRSVQQLLMIISKEDELGRMEEVIAVPDQGLAKNQLQALQNRNKYLSAFRANIAELKVQITYLQKEVQSKGNGLSAKNEELEAVVKRHNLHTLELEGEWTKTAENFGKHIQGLEAQLSDLRSEKEKLQNKHKTLTESYEQERGEREQLQRHLLAVKDQLKALEELNLQLRSREISKKGEDESLIHNLKVELKSQLDKQQEKIDAQKKDIEGHLKSISDKDRQISTLKTNLASTEQQKAKIQSTLQQLQEKYSKLAEDKTTVDQNLIESQKKIVSLKEDLEKTRNQTASERELKDSLQQKLKQAHEHASELMVSKENLESRLDSILKSSNFSQEEQRGRIAQLEESLQAESKRAGKYFKDLTEKTGELELKEFLTKQLEQKLSELEVTANDLRKDLEDKRTAINRLTVTVEDQNRTLMAVEKEKLDHLQEKGGVEDELALKKDRIAELQSEMKGLAQQLEKIGHQLEDSQASEAELREERASLQASLNELRENLTESRKEVQRWSGRESEGRTKLSLLQQQLREREEFYQSHKSKNQEQNQREVGGLREKAKQLQAKLDILHAERENERENLKNQIEYVSHANQELEELLEEKEEVIEQQQAELLQAQARIISLNGELRNCLEAWEREKAASLPSRRQSAKIQEDMSKFQSYAADLDRKTKEMLSTAVLRAKDEAMAKHSQTLIELLELLHKSKSRALSTATDGEKEDLVREYERMREKAEQLLRSQRPVQ